MGRLGKDGNLVLLYPPPLRAGSRGPGTSFMKASVSPNNDQFPDSSYTIPGAWSTGDSHLSDGVFGL